jgi:hypothetical protein
MSGVSLERCSVSCQVVVLVSKIVQKGEGRPLVAFLHGDPKRIRRMLLSLSHWTDAHLA